MTRKVSRVNGDIDAKLRILTDKMARLDELEEVAVYAVETLNSVITTEKIALAVIERNILRSVSTIGKRVFRDLNLDRPSINARTIASKETQLVNDTREDPDYFPGDGRDVVTMLSELCIPMTHKGKVLGTINFECRQPGRFTEEEARVAEAFTREIAEAVSRVREEAIGEQEKRRRAKVRTTMENYLEILEAVHDGVGVLNRIVYRVALPWRRGKEMVTKLVDKGYLKREQISAARYIYKITDKGIETLEKYECTPECLNI